MRRATALATLLLVLASCASTQLPPISSQGGSFKPLRDEQALWDQSREEEKKLLENVNLYEDPLLESYLEGVVGRLNPPGMASNPAIRYRVRVIEDPTLNAFAYPHGSVYVHTGLLARMETEDELATVLGHEMTHVENRHMLRYQRSAHNKQIGLSIAAVAAAVVLADIEGDALGSGDWGKAATMDVVGQLIVNLGLGLAFLASVNGYGRGLEIEADEGGFAKMASAGYDLQQAPKVYQSLLDDRGEPKKMEAFFFGSHPRLTERIEHTKKYLAAHPDQVAAGSAGGGGRGGLLAAHPAGGAGRRPAEPRDGPAGPRREPARRRCGAGCPRIRRPTSSLGGCGSPRPRRTRTRPTSGSSATRPRMPSASRSSWTPAVRGRAASWGCCCTPRRTSRTPASSSGATSSWRPTPTMRSAVRDYVLEMERDGHCRR